MQVKDIRHSQRTLDWLLRRPGPAGLGILVLELEADLLFLIEQKCRNSEVALAGDEIRVDLTCGSAYSYRVAVLSFQVLPVVASVFHLCVCNRS